jgi:hypothetical protein
MQHHDFRLKLENWRGFDLLIEQDHSLPEVLLRQLLIGLRALEQEAGELADVGLFDGGPVHVDALYHDLLELLDFVGAQEALLVHLCGAAFL